MYLGVQLLKISRVDGQECWDMSYDNYFMVAGTNVEYVLENHGLRLMQKCITPLSCFYSPDMDVPEYIKADGVQWDQ